MTVYFILGLLLLALSPAVMAWRFGRTWMLRPFGIVVVMAVVYHGVAEIAVRVTRIDQTVTYRAPIEYVDLAVIAAGVCLLAATIGYVAFCPPGRVALEASDRAALVHAFDWRLTGVLVLPLFLATVAGRGYNSSEQLTGQGLTSVGFASQFFVTLIVLTSFGLWLRHPRWFAAIIAVQSAVIAIAGQRLEIFVAAALLCLLAHRVGISVRPRQLVASALVIVALAAAIGSVRASAGRDLFTSDSGFSARANALYQGVVNPDAAEGRHVNQPPALRLNANTFSGNVVQALETKEPIGPTPIAMTAAAAAPSVLFPGKVAFLAKNGGGPDAAQVRGLGLANVDSAPGQILYYLGALGLWGTAAFNLFFGAVMALIDRYLLTRVTASAVVGLLVAAQAALFFEKGLVYYVTSVRSIVLLGIVFWVWGRLGPVTRSRRAAGRKSPAPSFPTSPELHR